MAKRIIILFFLAGLSCAGIAQVSDSNAVASRVGNIINSSALNSSAATATQVNTQAVQDAKRNQPSSLANILDAVGIADGFVFEASQAAGLIFMMLGLIGIHRRRSEPSIGWTQIILELIFGLALFLLPHLV